MPFAKHLKNILPYIFAEINSKQDEIVGLGLDIINMAVSTPNRPTPAGIV
ncbi:hypothetical protein NDI37_10950 [Funiculus sociatus GB2-A5]|uniref:Uncharacterized protein n=1 Tax=Funiculus sociatus GB2-A5 TaxID=2933946 RepID=A0ABV0JNM2_9CYAN|nr:MULTISPECIES: hypothetical protein [unclassified Trichocoleus]MBD1904282.1 hypothetical protein [Trichocoleus sp. FACHB-832]MBD2064187.1 hypothetical protein [Trichocoleus sp. FACHB-6]